MQGMVAKAEVKLCNNPRLKACPPSRGRRAGVTSSCAFLKEIVRGETTTSINEYNLIPIS